MLRVSIVTCLIAIVHFPTCSSQGVAWSAQDQDIIFWKLKRICEYSDYKEYLKLYPDYEYVRDTQLNFPKVLRLAFHDCLKYNVSDLEEGQINGCDGCLNHNNNVNKGIFPVFKLLVDEKQKSFKDISHADFWQIAGIAALENANNKLTTNEKFKMTFVFANFT